MGLDLQIKSEIMSNEMWTSVDMQNSDILTDLVSVSQS